MNKVQTVHVGMLNSYNVITGAITIEEIIQSGIGVFAHVPDEEPDLESIEQMIMYFQDKEMYENCSWLASYIKDNFDKQGKRLEEECDCYHPTIGQYTKKMCCSTCHKRLRK
jgi:hypothetical protein